MHEIRIDPLTGARVIVAPAPLPPGVAAGTTDRRTAPAFVRLLDPGSADPPAQDNPELFVALAARGAHELLPVGSEPVHSLAELAVEDMAGAVESWRERMRAHDGAAYVHVSVDERLDADPVRAQLHALGFVPAPVARERERFSAYAVRTMGANLLEDLVADEVRRRERIVAIDDEAVLWCPYASQHPYQLMLAPRRRRERFQDDGATGAALLHRGLRLLRARFGSSPPLSLWVRTAPRGADRFCWRIDVVPRLFAAGGLELGTGLAHNPVAPEHAAGELRELHRTT
jgi:UDPglucose--hexose-1-phosphate uridylyltransferase